MKSLSVFAFLLCISVACGLKCYRCISTKSWDDCASVKKEMECTTGQDRCSKAYVKSHKDGISGEGYEKGCLSASDCDSFLSSDVCKDAKECKISCCTSDLCNGAALPVVSVIILTACAFIPFAF